MMGSEPPEIHITITPPTKPKFGSTSNTSHHLDQPRQPPTVFRTRTNLRQLPPPPAPMKPAESNSLQPGPETCPENRNQTNLVLTLSNLQKGFHFCRGTPRELQAPPALACSSLASCACRRLGRCMPRKGKRSGGQLPKRSLPARWRSGKCLVVFSFLFFPKCMGRRTP